MPINFGPATITHEGTDLGKTLGGGSLTLHSIDYRGLRTHEVTLRTVGGEGVINLFEFSEEIYVSSDLLLYDYGELIIETPLQTIILPSCKIFYPTDLTFGINEQKAYTLKLVFKPGSDGTTIIIQ